MTRTGSVFLLIAAAAPAACAGWEGPGNWLDKDHAVGQPASVCTPGGAQESFAAEHEFDSAFAGWTGSVRAQSVKCIDHTDPLNISKAAWIECDVIGPALITHSPAINGAETFTAPAGRFELRATRRGLSCKPA